ncbi:MAG TPA: nucleotidyltransferase domain-containing protein [Steroidobacteraceae bacterium]|nr:nucleotidyltransferase domain-containing protein [Steroidobacteraceae bacterium]
MESTINKIPEALPAAVGAWLSQSSQALIDCLGEDLETLILFGSAAEGLMRASSDVNLLVVLRKFDPDRIDRASGVLQDAAAAVELHPMFLLGSELSLAAESFSVKFDDIAHRHVVLYGKDPFEALTIPRALLVRRLQQVLFNLTLRLRTLYATGRAREETLAAVIADAAAPLRRSAHAILELRGNHPTAPKAALESLAAELGGDWTSDLQNLSRAREDLHLDPGTAANLILRLAELSESLRQRAASLS